MWDGASYTLKGLFFEGGTNNSDLFMTKIAGIEPAHAPEPVNELPDLGYVNIYYIKGLQKLIVGDVYKTLQNAMLHKSESDSNIHVTTIRLQDIPEVREILKTIKLD